jgi:hypothetical protein
MVELVLETGDDAEQLEADLQSLIAELHELDLEDLQRPARSAPDGVRGVGGFELGTLLVAVGGAGATVPALIGLLQDWLRRRRSGAVRVKLGDDEIELTGVSPKQQERLVEAFLARHSE